MRSKSRGNLLLYRCASCRADPNWRMHHPMGPFFLYSDQPTIISPRTPPPSGRRRRRPRRGRRKGMAPARKNRSKPGCSMSRHSHEPWPAWKTLHNQGSDCLPDFPQPRRSGQTTVNLSLRMGRSLRLAVPSLLGRRSRAPISPQNIRRWRAIVLRSRSGKSNEARLVLCLSY